MSELRQDLVSGDWVLIAPDRAARPHDLFKNKQTRKPASKKNCPFEDLEKSGNWPLILSWPNEKTWKIAVIKNKYPALEHIDGCSTDFQRGPYLIKTAAGEHNLVITRDHNKNFSDLSNAEAFRLFQIFQELHNLTAKDECSAYMSIFANWGPSVGASIYHPHYQTLALPILPPHTRRSIDGAERYWKKFSRCVRCTIIKDSIRNRTRIVEENRYAIAITPFASKHPFEVQILPKKHLPAFRKTPMPYLRGAAFLLCSVLRKMKKYLNDPDYNFFIHGAPLDYRRYQYHHWHIEVIPKISIPGGFELSTGIDINVIDPEKAAAILRGEK